MHVLQLAQREALGQKREADIGIIELAAQAQHRQRNDVGMVEGERDRAFRRGDLDRAAGLARPRHRDGRGEQARRVLQRGGERGFVEQREIGDRDDPHARIACDRAEGVELFEMCGGDSRLVAQHARGGVVERLVDADEPARQRAAPGEGRCIAFHQQHRRLAAANPEQHQIDRDRRPLIGVGIIIEGFVVGHAPPNMQDALYLLS